MELTNFVNKIGDFAKDIKLNLKNVLGDDPQSQLSNKQILGTALASAYATGNEIFYNDFKNYAEAAGLSETELNAAKIASTLMAMNNVYYRSIHFASHSDYSALPPNLRMLSLRQHGIEQGDFEMYALAVSAINGCEFCVDAHIKQLESHGFSRYDIQRSIRIAAVIAAAAQAWGL